MPSQIQIELLDLLDESVVFWSAGNYPTQILSGRSTLEVILHLKALYLLTDRVLASASFYFESPITREATQSLQGLFERGEILYFGKASIEDFAEHGALKAEKSPPGLLGYQDKQLVQERAKKLDSLGYILRRSPSSLSERITQLWRNDISSTESGTLGDYLHLLFKNERARAQLTIELIHIPENRGGEDFVWEYLYPILKKSQLPNSFIRVARRRLSQMYAVATSEVLGVPLDQDSSLSSYITHQSYYNSSLFLNCMNILGVMGNLQSLPPADLIKLKSSDEFIWFKSFYFKLLEAIGYQLGEVKIWLLKYKEAAFNYSKSRVSINDFLKTFRSLCRTLGKPQKQYSRPLEVLLYTYDLAHRLTIEEFVAKLESLARITCTDESLDRGSAFQVITLAQTHNVEEEKMDEKTAAKKPQTEGRIFIGHGHSRVWKELKDFLQDRLHLEWDEFNREETAGLSTKEVLVRKLSDAKFAFLIMTAEDEHINQTKHARENVIHEAGLFQGKLSFERAIILLEEGCEEFSNILGISQIRFPVGNIEAKFEQIRRVLEREGIV